MRCFGATFPNEYVTLDPFRVHFSDEFDWLIPSELRSRLDIVSPTTVHEDRAPLAERMERALNDPSLEVNLAQLVTPGDRVAIAVDPHTPSLIEVLHELLRELARLQVSMAESCIVLPAHAKAIAASIRSMTATDAGSSEVAIHLHDAADRSAIAYLAATAEGEPIYIARPLADADVVIPIFAASGENAARTGIAARFLYRCFSGAPSVESGEPNELRKRKPDRAREAKQIEHDANEAFWQLGVLFGVMIGAESGGNAGQIFAGSPSQLDRAVTASQRDWECAAVAPATLVIAEVSGGVDQQHWSAAAQALNLARELATPEGMIVLLTDVAAGEISRKALRASRRKSKSGAASDDLDEIGAFSAALNSSGDSNPIFMRSQLSEEATEELGIGFVSKPSELNRLIERQTKCVLIRDAQHVQLSMRAFSTPPTSR